MQHVFAGIALIALGIVPSAGAAAAPSHGLFHPPRHLFGRGTSTNWSGYDVTGSNATHVIGSWTQPRATCSPGENSWSSPWVGIDGDTSNTVEQTGTDTDCSNGQPFYYAWYEMYPKGLVTIGNIAVHPGDGFTGEVTYLGRGSFRLTLTDNTTHASFSTTQSRKRASLASVEAIMEGPSNSGLTKFGSVSFSGVSATINNATNDLGLLSPLDPITMVTSGGATRAQPGSISNPNGGSSFSMAWKHS